MTTVRFVLAEVAAELGAGRACVLLTVVDAKGSTPRKPGARMLYCADGRLSGTIGGGVIEHQAALLAAEVMQHGTAELAHYDLTADLAMCCGGRMSVFIERLDPAPELLVFGCGHIGRRVVELAQTLGFAVTAIDDVPEQASVERFPNARVLHTFDTTELDELPFGANTYVVIVTREHQIDQRLLELCLQKPAAYIGVIGSARKAEMQLKRLRAKGFPEDAIARVRCPMGLDIGAETPEEIALAICAELVEKKRGHSTFFSAACASIDPKKVECPLF